jgi:CheY-like chemotaxis protein
MADEADWINARNRVHRLNNLFQVIMGSLELLKRSREVSLETIEAAIRATQEASLIAQQLLASAKRSAGEPPRAQPGETVLLVEDDGEVRRWVASALEALGYRVLQAADAGAALELLESPSARRIDLLFTDVVLSGGMTGRELAESLAARRPGVPVLFTSGYPREGRAARESVDLEKPYELERLAATVRSTIDSLRSGDSLRSSEAASSSAAASDTGRPKK